MGIGSVSVIVRFVLAGSCQQRDVFGGIDNPDARHILADGVFQVALEIDQADIDVRQ